MKTDIQRDHLLQKVEDLEPGQLGSAIDFVDFLLDRQRSKLRPKTMEERMRLVEKNES
jgi:hypothetical protein